MSGGKAMIPFDGFEVSTVNHGFFWLDGGAMFGPVPKTIWSRLIPADGENRIRLATRSLVVQADERVFIADLGNGEKLPDKLRGIYRIENFKPEDMGFDFGAVTDVLLSHLHFDHCGGISRFKPGSSEVDLSFPKARVHLQAAQLETARSPNPHERASFLKENVQVLEKAALNLVRGSQEIHPGLWVHRSDGHTRGLMWVEVRNGSESIVFPSDLIPTSRHLPLPFTMGYDICVETLVQEKENLLNRAVAGDWIIVFAHDPDIPAARVRIDDRGRYAVREVVNL
jgi:glyoxylase-like metal-dependent hydrolase (beta-lactamase superfamily II)